jgi:hypothetical protein
VVCVVDVHPMDAVRDGLRAIKNTIDDGKCCIKLVWSVCLWRSMSIPWMMGEKRHNIALLGCWVNTKTLGRKEFSIVLSILKCLSQISFPNYYTKINFMP